MEEVVIVVKYLILLFVSFSMSSFAKTEIIESKSICDLIKHIDKETFVLLDIDDTLIKSSRFLGSSQCEEYMIKSFLNAGFDKKQSIDKEEELWFKLLEVNGI